MPIAKLGRADRYRAPRRRRPEEPAALQALGVERDPQTVMPEDFYEVASTPSENIQIPRVRIVPEILLDLEDQGVHAAPHVGHPGRQPDPNTARNRDHRRARTESTRASAEPSTSRSTITREPSASRDLHPSRRQRIARDGIRQGRPCPGRLHNHRHQPARHGLASPLAVPPTPGEKQIGVDVVAPRHNRYRYPGPIGSPRRPEACQSGDAEPCTTTR